jgi:hypothetical protein
MEVLHRLHSLACVRVSEVEAFASFPASSFSLALSSFLFPLPFFTNSSSRSSTIRHVLCRANHTLRFTYLFFTVIETKGPLEEIAKLFDGDEAEPDLLESVAAQEEAARIAGMDGVEKDKVGSGRGEITQVENTGRG